MQSAHPPIPEWSHILNFPEWVDKAKFIHPKRYKKPDLWSIWPLYWTCYLVQRPKASGFDSPIWPGCFHLTVLLRNLTDGNFFIKEWALMEAALGPFSLPSGRAKDVAEEKPDGQFHSSSQILGLDQYSLAWLCCICIYLAVNFLTIVSRDCFFRNSNA